MVDSDKVNLFVWEIDVVVYDIVSHDSLFMLWDKLVVFEAGSLRERLKRRHETARGTGKPNFR